MRRQLARLLLPFAAAAAAACGSTPAPLNTFEPASAAETISAKNAKSLGWLTVAGQPSQEDLAVLAGTGIGCVINMRTAEEMADVEFDEAAEVESLGMRYVDLPVSGPDSLTNEFFEEARDTLRTCRHSGVLMH